MMAREVSHSSVRPPLRCGHNSTALLLRLCIMSGGSCRVLLTGAQRKVGGLIACRLHDGCVFALCKELVHCIDDGAEDALLVGGVATLLPHHACDALRKRALIIARQYVCSAH